MIESAIEQATVLLIQTEASDIFQQIAHASQVYRELPFTLQLGKRTINGVIDLLFFSKYQRWHVVDYKTSAVNFADDTDRAGRIWGHARRYHAQVGVYAAAVEALTGQTPDVHLHYIRYVHTVKVPPDVWKASSGGKPFMMKTSGSESGSIVVSLPLRRMRAGSTYSLISPSTLNTS